MPIIKNIFILALPGEAQFEESDEHICIDDQLASVRLRKQESHFWGKFVFKRDRDKERATRRNESCREEVFY